MKHPLLFVFATLFIFMNNVSLSSSSGHFTENCDLKKSPSPSTQVPDIQEASELLNRLEMLERIRAHERKSTNDADEDFLRKNLPTSLDDFMTRSEHVTLTRVNGRLTRTLTFLEKVQRNLFKTSIILKNGHHLVFFQFLREYNRERYTILALQLLFPSLNDKADTRATAFSEEILPLGNLRLKPNAGLESITQQLMKAGLMSKQVFFRERVRGLVVGEKKCIYTLPTNLSVIVDPTLSISTKLTIQLLNIIEYSAG